MADPHWTSYVGMATGSVALIFTYLNHRRVDSMKSLDLRIECKRKQLEFTTTLKKIIDLHNQANKSRAAVASATGMYNSGRMQIWKNQWAEDALKISELDKEKLLSDADFDSCALTNLESELLRIEGLLESVKQINDKYTAAIQDDDKTREELRRNV